jgi:hypothetical protein
MSAKILASLLAAALIASTHLAAAQQPKKVPRIGYLAADFSLKTRLPSMGNREFVEAGGLMSYGADLADSYRRVADYVDEGSQASRAAGGAAHEV